MKKDKKLWTIFLLLLAVNLVIFFFRDHFSYSPFAGEKELYAACDQPCIDKWKQSPADYPREELIEASAILDKNIPDTSLPTHEQVMLIGGFIYDRFHQQTGRPSDELLRASPLQQFLKLDADGKAHIWCGIYASLFNYFCWTRDIPCRTIEIMKPGDHHVVNEVYLKETRKWVMVDLTSNILIAQDENAGTFNLLSFINALENQERIYHFRSVSGGVHMDTLENFANRHYFQKEYDLYFYYRLSNQKIYSLKSKIKRYFLPKPFYSIFNFNKSNDGNITFYIKLFFIYSSLLVLIIIIYRNLFQSRKN